MLHVRRYSKTLTHYFPCEICETLKNTYFEENLRTTGFKISNQAISYEYRHYSNVSQCSVTNVENTQKPLQKG